MVQLCPPTRGPGGSIVLIHITNHTSLVQIVCSVAEKGKGLRKEAEADGYGGEGEFFLMQSIDSASSPQEQILININQAHRPSSHSPAPAPADPNATNNAGKNPYSCTYY